MAAIVVTKTLNNNAAFRKKLQAASMPKIRKLVDKIGETAVDEAEKIIAAELIGDRSSGSRKAGRHLAGSVRYQVEETDAGFVLGLRVPYVNQGKVEALEMGSQPGHMIYPGELGYLSLPRLVGKTTGKAGKGKTSNKSTQAYSSKQGRAMIRGPVKHPGNKPYRFMKRGLDRAIKIHLRGG